MNSIVNEQAVDALVGAARAAARYLPEPVADGVDFVQSLMRAGDLETGAISGETRELIEKQIQLQQEMLQVTLLSNIERTRHETNMAPARNVRLT